MSLSFLFRILFLELPCVIHSCGNISKQKKYKEEAEKTMSHYNAVLDTPEMQRVRENQKNFSTVSFFPHLSCVCSYLCSQWVGPCLGCVVLNSCLLAVRFHRHSSGISFFQQVINNYKRWLCSCEHNWSIFVALHYFFCVQYFDCPCALFSVASIPDWP